MNVSAKEKLKIVVYAISKNESKFVKRWVSSMQEADEIYVLDTGSTDDTVKLLKECNVNVISKTIDPWRFDVARNESIKLCPSDADLLVCTDLDEVFLSGWRQKLEDAWLKGLEHAKLNNTSLPTTAMYEYVWNFNADGSDGRKFMYEKIHAPYANAKWTHPVHEILSYDCKKTYVFVDGMRLEHHADPSKSRASYLGLLEMSVEESPNDDRNLHYLGREYMFRGMWDKAIDTLLSHLDLNSSFVEERAQSMRYIAKCYGEKHNYDCQELWLWRAIHAAPGQREAALDLANLFYQQKNWRMLVEACKICLSRKNRSLIYVTESDAWGFKPYDLLSLGLWYSGRKNEAIEAVEKAVELNPNNKRLLDNRKLMFDSLK